MKKLAFLSFALATIGLTAFGHLANQQPAQQVRAQEQPKTNGEVRFPTIEVEPIPLPKPTPAAVTTLGVDMLYVIDSDLAVLLFDSPKGMVKVAKEVGPLRVRGKFVGGVGVETKNFKGKQIYLIEAAKTGPVELIVVPVGAVDEKDALRRMLDVDAGGGPRPPPIPPGPTPTDAAFPLDGKVRVLFLEDASKDGRLKLTQGQLDSILAQATRTWLETHTSMGPDGVTREYRIYPVGVVANNPMWQRAVDRAKAIGKLPAMVVSNGKDAEYIGDMPTEGAMPTLKKIGGE